MLRLKATKNSLYKLAGIYVPHGLPGMRKTEFIKAPRQPDYWLKWYNSAADLFYEAFFSACGGRPLLAITAKDWDSHETSRVVHNLTVEDLRWRGMIEEVADRGPGN